MLAKAYTYCPDLAGLLFGIECVVYLFESFSHRLDRRTFTALHYCVLCSFFLVLGTLRRGPYQPSTSSSTQYLYLRRGKTPRNKLQFSVFFMRSSTQQTPFSKPTHLGVISGFYYRTKEDIRARERRRSRKEGGGESKQGGNGSARRARYVRESGSFLFLELSTEKQKVRLKMAKEKIYTLLSAGKQCVHALATVRHGGDAPPCASQVLMAPAPPLPRRLPGVSQ